MALVNVYVDGLNLYYGGKRLAAHQKVGWKWLDLEVLSRSFIDPQDTIGEIHYFTAHVSGREDPGDPQKQANYLAALKSNPRIKIYTGKFLRSFKSRWLKAPPAPQRVQVLVENLEEKGTDVNLASHLLVDAARGRFEIALVITNDTDLVTPVRLAISEFQRRVGILAPAQSCAPALSQAASFHKHVRIQHLRASQLPDPVIVGGKRIPRPTGW